MPLGRILLSSISESKKLSKIKKDGAKLLYTWLIPHVDVNGCYSADPRVVRNRIFTRLNKSTKTVEGYLEDLDKVELIVKYENDGDLFLIIPDFIVKQPYFNPTKEAKPVIPLPTPEQVKSRSRVSRDLIRDRYRYRYNSKYKSKDKGIEEEPLPQEDQPIKITKNFFDGVKNNTKEFQDFIFALSEKNNTDTKVIENELIKFTSYWTEKNHSGKKERWQLQKTFEVNRRLATWFSNINKFSGFTTQIKRGREILGLES